VFGRDRRGRTTASQFRARIFGPGTDVKTDFAYTSTAASSSTSRKAGRIETVINKPSDIGVLARLEHLPELVGKARGVNDRLLIIERAGQGCAIGDDLFDRLHQPYTWEGQRTGALRFGDPRAMALTGALCCVIHALTGFTNKAFAGSSPDSSTPTTAPTRSATTCDGSDCTAHREDPPHNTYRTTDEGIRAAVFYTKLRSRLLGPLLNAGHQPPAPLRATPRTRHHRPAAQHLHHPSQTPNSSIKTRTRSRGSPRKRSR
jgi:hypothetical protein